MGNLIIDNQPNQDSIDEPRVICIEIYVDLIAEGMASEFIGWCADEGILTDDLLEKYWLKDWAEKTYPELG